MNFGFVDRFAIEKSYRLTGGAMPINVQIRSSCAPAVSATYAPKENPAAHSSTPGYRAAMKSTAARKSSHSPRPSSHAPALRPTPRKLNRSTAQPMRASAFVPWKTTFVCIVPPCVGSGCAKTTAARASPAGCSSSTSSGPAGPAISRRGSGNLLFGLGEEPHHERCKFVRPRDHPEMSRALQRLDPCMRPDRGVFPRQARRHDTLERLLARDHQRRYFDARQPGVDPRRREEMHTSGHTAGGKHVAENGDSGAARCGYSAPPTVPCSRNFAVEADGPGAEERRQDPRVREGDRYPRMRPPRRRQRRDERQRPHAGGIPHGECRRNQPAERHAANRRPVEAARVERVAHLIDVVAEAERLVESRPGGRLVGKRERDDAASLRQRVDTRLHPFPAPLHARNHDDRNTGAAINDPH